MLMPPRTEITQRQTIELPVRVVVVVAAAAAMVVVVVVLAVVLAVGDE